MYSFLLNKFLLPLGSVFFSGDYSGNIKKWRKYDAMSEEELREIQNENLTEILAYAKTNVPYYKNLNLPENANLSDFPILTKQILREKVDALISEEYDKGKLEKNHSSGSSGVQSFTYMTDEHKFYLRALQTHWWSWSGYKPGDALLQTGISPKRSLPKKLKDVFFRVIYLESFSLQKQRIKNILEKSKSKKVKYIAGYPSALNEIALIAIEENKQMDIKSIISYGDKLFEVYINNYNKAFNHPSVINTYGCAEGLLMGCTADTPFYYIMSPHVFLEIVDDNGNKVKDGERGNILVTCLSNFAMPLIRYKLGDLGVILPKEKYPELRRFNYPLLQEVTGRETDVIKTPNGNVLVVQSFTGIFIYFTDIMQYKVIQVSKNRLLVEYVTDDKKKLSPQVEAEILDQLLEMTGNSMRIELNLVESISSSPSGKPQIIEIRNQT